VKKSVYYHDPCYLARYAGVIEPPRRVLGQIATVREFGWSRQDTECCGGGGLLPKTAPSTADAMARRRLAEVAAAGGGTVVTSCGTCAFMLRRNTPASVEVADLPTAIAQLTETPVEPLKPQLDDVTSG
jgi:Fe-S oxidoreductase